MPAHLGEAVNAPPARPKLQDPPSAGPTAHVELDLPAHVGIRVLDATAIADARNKERGQCLQPALASVLTESGTQNRRLDLSLEVGELPALALGLAVH